MDLVFYVKCVESQRNLFQEDSFQVCKFSTTKSSKIVKKALEFNAVSIGSGRIRTVVAGRKAK